MTSDRAGRQPECFGDRPNGRVAGVMAYRVVDRFEVVEVDEEESQHQGPLAPMNGGQVEFQGFDRSTSVEEPSERVTGRSLE